MYTNDWCIICRAIVFVHYTTATLLCIDSRIYGVSRYIRYITRSTYTSIYVRSSYSSNAEVLRFLHMCGSSDTPLISRTYVIRQVRRRYVALTPDTPHVRSHWRIQRGGGRGSGPPPPPWNCQLSIFAMLKSSVTPLLGIWTPLRKFSGSVHAQLSKCHVTMAYLQRTFLSTMYVWRMCDGCLTYFRPFRTYGTSTAN